MSIDELWKIVDGMTQDIEFDYNGVSCAVFPFARDRIVICYGEESAEAKSIEEAFNSPIFDGENLRQICRRIEFI